MKPAVKRPIKTSAQARDKRIAKRDAATRRYEEATVTLTWLGELVQWWTIEKLRAARYVGCKIEWREKMEAWKPPSRRIT